MASVHICVDQNNCVISDDAQKFADTGQFTTFNAIVDAQAVVWGLHFGDHETYRESSL